MKQIGFAIIIFLATFGRYSSQNVSVDLEGTILCENRTLQGALISVTRDGKPFTSFLTDIDGSYNLYLPIGSEFEITISKKDYVKKIYTVSTSGISFENAQKKFPVIVADVDLFLFYEGIDYSVFNQPMNKYYYNQKKDNFEFDKAYLKYMLAKVEEVHREEKKAIQSALVKAELDKHKSDLARLDAMKKEREVMEAAALKKPESEQEEAKKQGEEKSLVSQVSSLNEPMKEKPPVAKDATVVKPGKSERLIALLIKYKPGVTEEIIQGKNMVIIQRIVVRDEMAWVYQKKIFSWGGVACFRDGVSITENTFEQETKKYT